MFVIVNVKKSGKRKIRQGKTVDCVHEYKTSAGERFYIVDVFDSDKGVNWNETASFIGRHSNHILIDDSITPPVDCPVKKYNSIKFKNILLFNTVGLILKQMYLAGCRPKCFINDDNAQYAFLLNKIVKFSAQTTVKTNKSYLYYSHISSLYTQMGVSVTITDKAIDTDEDTIVIDTNSNLNTKSKMLFSVYGNGFAPKYVDGFNNLKSICPTYINTVDFLGAIYEFNREQKLEDALCRVVCKDNVNFSLPELSEKFINEKTSDNGRLFFCV